MSCGKHRHSITHSFQKESMETLFSYLDKGIDDMKAGRLHTVDDAFQF